MSRNIIKQDGDFNKKKQDAIVIVSENHDSSYKTDIFVRIRHINPYGTGYEKGIYNLYTNDEGTEIILTCQEINNHLIGENITVKVCGDMGTINVSVDYYTFIHDIIREFIDKYFPYLHIVEIICV